jgi:hypothetical protein
MTRWLSVLPLVSAMSFEGWVEIVEALGQVSAQTTRQPLITEGVSDAQVV